jgi:hypothetical protein
MLCRIARSYGDIYYIVAGVLWEIVGGDGERWCGVYAGASWRWGSHHWTTVMSVRVTALVGGIT